MIFFASSFLHSLLLIVQSVRLLAQTGPDGGAQSVRRPGLDGLPSTVWTAKNYMFLWHSGSRQFLRTWMGHW